MKSLETHKNIRKEVEVWGFAPTPFLIFAGIGLCSALIVVSDFSFRSFIIVLIINAISYVINKIILSNKDIMKSFLYEKFPKEITDLTKNKNGKS
ncbi:hypothetical protein C8D70_12312 [Chryseobacterium sp. CBTAP 102]|uniref:hypothetical protein n=1 Tax=Chryseobacterium sp. CBTAP 102 TaxID=2135644 RepID=UPI000D75EF57|nr:hypothetical protein [Chryseobacterium sp. CBTAP 102]PXW07097.1 hypothetical protein C8D70_12312 [Chryseobacterium sp. CBTAP 102]